MAYESKNLSVLAYANGFTLWHYTTTDLNTQVDDVSYFDDAADMLRVGDMVMANTDTGEGGTPIAALYAVASNDGTTVDLTDMTQIGVLNSD
ncbi:hypothetical protein [Magnetospira sp. QH-2]|uniref:hypothetical protein n=1 Tax=Magnetospira sp. (strain QH-2) TaxID=1288970 RepID=UPI0003E817F8|nr:hypothetical protein [Magnetospira sp. QH-2]CCQ72330.1 conserved protein of unknown function [Magnetospira sp. QH-2]